MVYCCVPYCKSSRKQPNEAGMSFHEFPCCKLLRLKWIVNIARLSSDGKNVWMPSDRSVVCSLHFTADCFKTTVNGKRRLLIKDAVPTVFPGYPSYKTDECHKRFKYKPDIFTRNKTKTTDKEVDEEKENAMYQNLSFLTEHIKHQGSSSNCYNKGEVEFTKESSSELCILPYFSSTSSIIPLSPSNSTLAPPTSVLPPPSPTIPPQSSSSPSIIPQPPSSPPVTVPCRKVTPTSKKPKRNKSMEDFLLKELEATNALLMAEPSENETFAQFVVKSLDNIKDKKKQSDLRLRIAALIHGYQFMSED